MRKLLPFMALIALSEGAHAADMPVLRGGFFEPPARGVNWQGAYLGVQAGYGSSDENFGGSTNAMNASLLANTLIEAEMGVSRWPLGFGKESSRSTSFGGFAGYNSQWDDVVYGLEVSYLHGTFGGSSTGGMARRSLLSDGLVHSVDSQSVAYISIQDIATFRARAGYAFGSFLPYMFGGLALGNGEIGRASVVRDTEINPSTNLSRDLRPLSDAQIQHGHLLYGYTAGLGVDVNLIGGLFLRAEWEYLRFTSSVDTTINTVRAGLGYKF
jgi:outer membrane immunogenic protein